MLQLSVDLVESVTQGARGYNHLEASSSTYLMAVLEGLKNLSQMGLMIRVLICAIACSVAFC